MRPRCITRFIPRADSRRTGIKCVLACGLAALMPEVAALGLLHGMLATFAVKLAGMERRRLGRRRLRGLRRVLVAAGGLFGCHTQILIGNIRS